MVTIDHDRAYYRWRQMTDEQRQATLEDRRRHKRPWHSPPHYESDSKLYLITATCFEHQPIIGLAPDRMSQFESDLLATMAEFCPEIFAWNVLPNHYHVLVHAPDIKALLKRLGQLHGRTSFEWNGAEDKRGRQVFCNAVETGMKSDGHFWATLNYVLNNAVHHRYVTKWQDWPYSNWREYLEETGRDECLRRWRNYPIDRYGATWDPPSL